LPARPRRSPYCERFANQLIRFQRNQHAAYILQPTSAAEYSALFKQVFRGFVHAQQNLANFIGAVPCVSQVLAYTGPVQSGKKQVMLRNDFHQALEVVRVVDAIAAQKGAI
jgi:hypothetical protein